MLKMKVLKVIIPIMALALISQAITGLNHKKIDDEVFEKIHFGGALLLLALVLVHVILNWSWIITSYRKHVNSKE